MERHPLDKKLLDLRCRARRLAMIYGASLAVAALLAAAVVLGTADYLMRFEDRGLRVILSLMWLVAVGAAGYRGVLALLALHVSDVALAVRVRWQFPQLDDSFVSAVQFLRCSEADPATGSPALRQAVVEQATMDAVPLSFDAILDKRPMVRTLMLLIAVGLVAAIMTAANPSAVGTALTRLANPMSNAAWPRTTHLALREPVDRVARGRAFQVEAFDEMGASLPADVRIHYRFAGHDGATVEEIQRMRQVDETMVARRENVLRPFSYRVEGGDDLTMAWRDVQIVEPPAVASVTVRVIPPAYTGWPAVSTDRHIRALAGARVEIAGKSTVPLRGATLCIDGETRIPATMADDGRTFAVEFTVTKTASYWFALIDRDGLRGGGDDRWEIHAIPDLPPIVAMEHPASNLSVTPWAVLPLRIAAKDDLAVAGVAVEYQRPGAELKVGLPLWSAAAPPQSEPLAASDIATKPDRRAVDYRWDLGPLELKPGMQLTFCAIATDFRHQTARSEPRVLTIITVEELQARIANREKLMVAELQRAVKIEQGCLSQIGAIRERFAGHAAVQSDVDRMQATVQNQRDVDRILTSTGEGVPMHILALLSDLENNGVQGDDILRSVASLSAELDRIRRDHLAPIDRDLTAAVKATQANLEDSHAAASRVDAAAMASLSQAAEQQAAVIHALNRQIQLVTQRDNYRRFGREMAQLLREQEDVARQTTDVGRRTLTRELLDLSSRDAADLKVPAAQELELARRLDRLLQEMDRAIDDLRAGDPAAAKTVAAAIAEARQLAISGTMREVGRRIQQNQIGRAAASQKQIGRDLQTVVAILDAGGGDATRPGTAKSKSGESPKQGEAKDTAKTEPPKQGEAGESSAKQSPGSGAASVTGDGKTRRPDAEEMRTMMKRLWGELPEHARERMLQSPVEQFPPKYETMIEEYYRRLAEESK